MKEPRVEMLVEELRNTINRANRIMALLNSKDVSVKINALGRNNLDIVDIIQKVKY